MKPDQQRLNGAPTTAPTRSAGSLQESARQAIEAGKLPGRSPDRTWGGPGAGGYCTICGAPVQSDEVELEMEFARDGAGSGFDRHHVHFRCFAAWEAELRKLGPDERPRALAETGKKGHNGRRGDNGYRRGSA